MKILGLSYDFHDSAAALLVDGEIVAAAQEERFSRDKNDARFPRNAIDFCLRQAGLSAGDIDRVAYYEEPLLKFDRVVASAQANPGEGAAYLDATLSNWLSRRKFDVRAVISERVGIDPAHVEYMRHHESHAASAFFCSAFDEATVVTLDGVGEYETATISHGRGTTLERLGSVELPNSIGLFYSAWTAFLGFKVNEGEYKVMGMAGFGTPTRKGEMLDLFELFDDGTFALDQANFNFRTPRELPYTDVLLDRMGPAREMDSSFAVSPDHLPSDVDPANADEIIAKSRFYADVAASVQACTEEVILHMVDRAVARTGSTNVCLAGGVALNSLANGRLIRERGYSLYIHPAAGDAGNALGAALALHHRDATATRVPPLPTCALGEEFDDAQIARAIAASGFETVKVAGSDDELAAAVADLLAEGNVIGWLQGRAEWGPRALGRRSILANPTLPEMQRRVNEKIKFREPFRPFAPAVRADAVQTYLDMPALANPVAPERFMLAVHPVRDEWRAKLPAITHVDGTARVQAVTEEENPVFYRLIDACEARYGVPIVLNTSFNLNGEPIVNSPRDALNTFTHSEIDYLVMGRRIVSRKISL